MISSDEVGDEVELNGGVLADTGRIKPNNAIPVRGYGIRATTLRSVDTTTLLLQSARNILSLRSFLILKHSLMHDLPSSHHIEPA
jgi:hypothetical protein